MTTSINNITGDKLKSKPNSDKYRDNYDKVFSKSRKVLNPPVVTENTVKIKAAVRKYYANK